jgi:cell division protein FtsW (lipid II flippase)
MNLSETIPDLAIVPEREELRVDHTERTLLIIATVFLAVNYLSLAILTGPTTVGFWVQPVLWLICAWGGHILLERRLPQHDPFLFAVPMFLSGAGLILIDRLAPDFATRQSVWLLIATGLLLITALQDYLIRWLKQYRYMLLLVGLILLSSTILFGTNPSGAATAPRLWLNLANFYVQPSELLKVILVAFLASYLAEQYPILRATLVEESQRRIWFLPRVLGPILLMWALSIVILIWQRDLGTAMLFFIVFILLIYVASGYFSVLLGGLLLTLIAGVAAYQLFDVVQLRIDIWLNPWADADNRSYQIVQSLMAISSGQIFGQGISQGLPTVIPVVHSDFIFAALAEEWGLIGITVVVTCFAVIAVRGFRIAVLQPDRPFSVLLAVGLSMMLAVQAVMIMGGVLKLIPLTGVTLPFVSYGGSSLLISFVMIGLLLRLSTSDA